MAAAIDISRQTPLGAYPALDTFLAGDLVMALTAAQTAADYNTFTCTGGETLVVWNSSTDTEYDLTIHSVVDDKGRTGDVVETIQEQTIVAFRFTSKVGWADSGTGKVTVQGENAALKMFVLAK